MPAWRAWTGHPRLHALRPRCGTGLRTGSERAYAVGNLYTLQPRLGIRLTALWPGLPQKRGLRNSWPKPA